MKRQRCHGIAGLIVSLCLHLAWAQPLPLDKAFHVQAELVDHVLKVDWRLAPQTFLYADQLRFSSPSLDHGALLHPSAQTLKLHGHAYAVYAQRFSIGIPLIARVKQKVHQADLSFQGCTKDGFCYPPQQLHWRLDLAHNRVLSLDQADAITTPNQAGTTQPPWTLLLSFFTMGLLTAFTPCVWPMLPVLMKLLVGQRQATNIQRLKLSLCYVLSMAMGFALLGALFQPLGSNLQLYLQTPLILGSYAVLLILMGLSMLRSWPWLSRWTQTLETPCQRLPQGRATSAMGLGLASVLIGSPCVTPPLVAGLALASQQHTAHAVLALWTMGLGMGTPLLIFATTLGRFLPTSGPWLEVVKRLIAMGLMAAGLLFVYKLWPQPHRATTIQTVRTASAWSSVLKEAPIHQKQLLVDVYASWCNNCLVISRWLEKPDFLASLHHWRVIKLDISSMKPGLPTLLRNYGVVAPPTLLFLDAHGQTLAPPLIGQAITPQRLAQRLQQLKR